MNAIAAKVGSVWPLMRISSTTGLPLNTTRCVAPAASVRVCTIVPLLCAWMVSAVLSSKLPAISECSVKSAASVRVTVQVSVVAGAVSSARTAGASGAVCVQSWV